MIKLIIIVVVVGALLYYLWGRWSRAARFESEDDAIYQELEPLHRRISAGESVPPSEIEAIASNPRRRLALFDILESLERTELFPDRLLTPHAQAEARLTRWLTMPTELEELPEELEYLETQRRQVFGHDGDFLVFRYRMPEGHWAGSDWILGLVGPYFEGAPPYRNIAGAFSRAEDLQSRISPTEVVDWYVSFLRQRAGA